MGIYAVHNSADAAECFLLIEQGVQCNEAYSNFLEHYFFVDRKHVE